MSVVARFHSEFIFHCFSPETEEDPIAEYMCIQVWDMMRSLDYTHCVLYIRDTIYISYLVSPTPHRAVRSTHRSAAEGCHDLAGGPHDLARSLHRIAENRYDPAGSRRGLADAHVFRNHRHGASARIHADLVHSRGRQPAGDPQLAGSPRVADSYYGQPLCRHRIPGSTSPRAARALVPFSADGRQTAGSRRDHLVRTRRGSADTRPHAAHARAPNLRVTARCVVASRLLVSTVPDMALLVLACVLLALVVLLRMRLGDVRS